MGAEVASQRGPFGLAHPAKLVERLDDGGLEEDRALAVVLLGFLDRHDAGEAEQVPDGDLGGDAGRLAQGPRAPGVGQAEGDVGPDARGGCRLAAQGHRDVHPATGDPPLDQPADIRLAPAESPRELDARLEEPVVEGACFGEKGDTRTPGLAPAVPRHADNKAHGNSHDASRSRQGVSTRRAHSGGRDRQENSNAHAWLRRPVNCARPGQGPDLAENHVQTSA